MVVYLKMSLFHFHFWSLVIEFWVDAVPLPSGLHCFWLKESHPSYHCFSICNMCFIWLILRFFSLSFDFFNYDVPRVTSFFYLSHLGFVDLLSSVNWCSSLNLGGFKPLFLEIPFFCTFITLLYLWGTNYTDVRPLDIVSLVSVFFSSFSYWFFRLNQF